MAAYDAVVVGSGPGGFPAALALASRGLRVAVVEEHLPGGECVNYGCVPSKALLHAARVVWEGRRLGLRVEAPGGWPWGWVSQAAESTRRGVEAALEAAGAELVRGRARLAGRDGGRVRVKVEGYGELEAGSVLLAPGSDPKSLPGLPIGGRVLDNRVFYEAVRETPESVVIVGAGPVGVEAAFALAWLGARVVLVEALSRVLPAMDRDLSAMVARGLRRAGVKVYTGAKARLEPVDGGVRAVVAGEEGVFDYALIAVGRAPRTAGIGLETVGVEVGEGGFIRVGPGQQAAPGVYAAGDAAGPPLLAHKAMYESLVAAAGIAGIDAPRGKPLVPVVVFGDPEVASVGLTLEEARRQGIPAGEARLNLAGNPRVRIENDGLGLVKIVYRRDNGSILGVHVAGPNASEAIAAAVQEIESGSTLREAAWRIAPHMTTVESIGDAIKQAIGLRASRLRRRPG
ncbi:dihydrolipoyl dehydrogenase family protein [Stetteria hydrogenophila]